ncbi:hypothetical protein [Mycolicibacterium moriokaense]|uniref:hypothetical protein n=1 Tax=Mycolicibacterium moriokaense TaxID=39691 RepID=UPI001F3C4950|nr:hypothetical protein [Mycolicibacterium moriokaense]
MSEPDSKRASLWRAELGHLKALGRSEDDPGVRACRAGLAYWTVRRAIDAARPNLTAAGVDALAALLLGLGR